MGGGGSDMGSAHSRRSTGHGPAHAGPSAGPGAGGLHPYAGYSTSQHEAMLQELTLRMSPGAGPAAACEPCAAALS